MSSKTTKKVLKEARRGGLVVAKGRQHYKVLTPEGELVTVLPLGGKHLQHPDRRNFSLHAVREAIAKQIKEDSK